MLNAYIIIIAKREFFLNSWEIKKFEKNKNNACILKKCVVL